MLEGNKEILRLNKTSWVYGLFFTAQLARSSAGLKEIAIIDNIMIVLQICCFLFCLWHRINKKKFSILDIFIVIFYFSLLISTIIVSRDFISWATYTVQGIGSVFLIQDMIKENEKRNIKVIRNVIFIFIFINLISLLLLPNDLFGGYFFLGSRIGFTPFCIFAVLVSLLYDYINKIKKLSISSFIIILIAILNLVLERVTTGIVGLLILAIVLIIGQFINKNKFYILNYTLFFVLSLSIWGIIVLDGSIGATGILQSFLAFLGEDTTFGGRTIIWQTAFTYISQRPIWGYGVTPLGAFYIITYINRRSLPAHNELLNLLYQGGIAAFICWNLLFIVVGRGLCKCKDRYIFSLMLAVLFSFSCIAITEIQSQKAIIFLIFALAYQMGINHSREGLKHV